MEMKKIQIFKAKKKKKMHHTNKCLFLIMVDFVVRVTKNIPKHFQKYVNMRSKRIKWRIILMMIQTQVYLIMMNLIKNLIMTVVMVNLRLIYGKLRLYFNNNKA